jgi:hypothetical protein
MIARFEAPMLLILRCPSASRWYARHLGRVVPYRGFDKTDGWVSTEPGGYTNFVRHEDATLVTTTFTAEEVAHWPWSHVPRKMMESVKPKHVAQAKPLLPCGCSMICIGDDYCEGKARMRVQRAKAKGQSHAHSWTEAAVNIAVGFAVSVVITALVLPAYGHHVTLSENLQITAIFTVASLLRSYALRRLFNHITTREPA